MDQVFVTATLWFGLAVASALLASLFRLSIAPVEICLGVIAITATSHLGLRDILHRKFGLDPFSCIVRGVLLTFLAGAELDPVHRTRGRRVRRRRRLT